MKYEQEKKKRPITHENRTQVNRQIVHAPENVINVTIIKEASPNRCNQLPTAGISKSVGKRDAPVQTESTESNKETGKEQIKPTKKRLLRLPKHIRTNNPKIIYKKSILGGVKGGVLVRNTPTDLYKKYQNDWIKFKSFIPGESDRPTVRRSIRKKMQQKEKNDEKVRIK